jgi:hypothetical protein
MSPGDWFWIIWVISLLFSGWTLVSSPGDYRLWGMSLIPYVLFGLLGWKVFGPVLHG